MDRRERPERDHSVYKSHCHKGGSINPREENTATNNGRNIGWPFTGNKLHFSLLSSAKTNHTFTNEIKA